MDAFDMVTRKKICPICKEKLIPFISGAKLSCKNCQIIWRWLKIQDYIYWKEKLKREK